MKSNAAAALRVALLALTVAAPLLGSGCFLHRHTVGDGPQGGEVRVHRTWYAIWGAVPMSPLDTRDVVGAARNYRISTGIGTSDFIINLFAAPFSLVRQTTRVEK